MHLFNTDVNNSVSGHVHSTIFYALSIKLYMEDNVHKTQKPN